MSAPPKVEGPPSNKDYLLDKCMGAYLRKYGILFILLGWSIWEKNCALGLVYSPLSLASGSPQHPIQTFHLVYKYNYISK